MTSITNKQQLLQLIEKHRQGTTTEAEEALLTQWFDQVPTLEAITFTSEEEKEDIRSNMRDAIFQKIGEGREKQPAIVQPLRSRKRWTVGIAAAALLCISLLGYFFFAKEPQPVLLTITAPAGIQKLPVMLPDSSVVWLAGGSSLRYPEQFPAGSRKVRLDGVAFFSVHHDEKAPFTVTTPEALSVRVLGTSFVVDVRKNTQRIKVSVITGRVQVEEDKKGLSVLLPGEKLSYSCRSHTFEKSKYLPEEVSEWKNNGTIYLNNVSLNELSVILQTIYRLRLVYDPGQMIQYRFSMSFSRELTGDQVLDMLRVTSGLHFDKKGNEVGVTEQ
ncbi:FecR family protein [Taibaiella koreensis]|uniref:FecR family protein n=1 Tax=Taibaiella koreensis TaxID=1268548 RepID=UPI000E59990B|nr:FecR domain-containing protein [Taibaiella koreensis]